MHRLFLLWLHSCYKQKSLLPEEAALLKSPLPAWHAPLVIAVLITQAELLSLPPSATSGRITASVPSSSALLISTLPPPSTVKHHYQKSPPWPICWPGPSKIHFTLPLPPLLYSCIYLSFFSPSHLSQPRLFPSTICSMARLLTPWSQAQGDKGRPNFLLQLHRVSE